MMCRRIASSSLTWGWTSAQEQVEAVHEVLVSAEPVDEPSDAPAIAAFALVLALIAGASMWLWRAAR